MKAKKIAIKGLIAVAALVAVCMFFSGTIRNIATAKVKMTQPRSGKLTQSVELKSTLEFSVNNDVVLPDALDVNIEVKRVKAEAGYQVKKGDVIFTGAVADFDKTMQQYRDSYNEAQAALNALEDKGIRLRRTDEAWAQAYDGLSQARSEWLDADLAYRARLKVDGLEAGEDDALPEDASDELKALYETRQEKKAALDQAQQAMDTAERYSVSDDTRQYITDRAKYQQQMDQAEQNMLQLTVLNESLKSVAAPDDGYITKLNIKPGDTFNATQPYCCMCPEDELPTLRADVSECPLTITKGMAATLTGRDGASEESKVEAVGVTAAGGKYADIKLGKKLIKNLGGLYAISSGAVTVKVEYKAKQSSTLMPAAAVRGSGDDRYVFVVQDQESSFGTKKQVLSKQSVTVLAESGGTVSVQEDLTYLKVAYMEDRSVSEGDSVMEYTN